MGDDKSYLARVEIGARGMPEKEAPEKEAPEKGRKPENARSRKMPETGKRRKKEAVREKKGVQSSLMIN